MLEDEDVLVSVIIQEFEITERMINLKIIELIGLLLVNYTDILQLDNEKLRPVN